MNSPDKEEPQCQKQLTILIIWILDNLDFPAMSTLPFFFVVSTLLILVSFLVVFEEGVSRVQSKSAACILYDPIVKVIAIKCKTTSLRDIANELMIHKY